MQFRWADTHWRVTFRPRGDTIALPRVLHFGDAEKLRDIYRRFGTRHLSEDAAALEFAIRTRRGAVELMLGKEQLSKLQESKRPSPNTDLASRRT